MKDLKLVKSVIFEGVSCDIYSDGEVTCMTSKQLGEALGYSTPRESVNKIVQRNPYLNDIEFSAEVILTSPSGLQNTRIFNEDGIYEVSMLAKTERANEFRGFIRKVLKSVRKHGAYMTDEVLKNAITDPDFLIGLLTQLKEDKEKIKELTPKAEFYDAVAGSSTAISIGETAKILNMKIGRNKLFEFLRENKVLMADNLPYQQYCDRGYFRVIEQKYSLPNGDTDINIKTLVYQEGVEFIRKLLIKNGIKNN